MKNKENFLYQEVLIPNLDKIYAEIQTYDRLLNYKGKFSLCDVAQSEKSLPTLWSWFQQQKLCVHLVCHIHLFSGVSQPIHTDANDPILALNFPISGCETTPTVFYKNKGTFIKYFTPKTNLPYFQYTDSNPEEIGRYTLTKPTLINIKTPHAVLNSSNFDRVCFSFRFKPDPWNLVT